MFDVLIAVQHTQSAFSVKKLSDTTHRRAKITWPE
jgi:hypothetical protein